MMENFSELGVGAIFALMIIREFLNFLKDKKLRGAPDYNQTCFAMLKDLHDWHNREDEDGVKVWYVQRSLEKAINSLSKNIEMQNRLTERLIDRIVRMDDDIRNGK